jgi:hypothetical protein
VPPSTLGGNERVLDDPGHRGGGHDDDMDDLVPWWEQDQSLPILPSTGEGAGFTLARVAVLDAVVAGLADMCRLPSSQAWVLLAAVTMWAMIPGANVLCAVIGAGLTWLIGTGFVVHRHGDLSFTTSDEAHLALLVFMAGLVLLINRRGRSAHGHAGRPSA